MAYTGVLANKNGQGTVTANELQNELDVLTGSNKTLVTENNDNTLNVKFTETEHNYNVNKGEINEIETFKVFMGGEEFEIEKGTTWADLISSIEKDMEKYNILFTTPVSSEGNQYSNELNTWYLNYFGKEAESPDDYNMWYRLIQYYLYMNDRFLAIGFEPKDMEDLSNPNITEEEIANIYNRAILLTLSDIIDPNYLYMFSWDW